MKKVVKFGGSSLADAGQFAKVASIIRADETRCFVVPSAPGKRFSGDTKVTDLLLKLHRVYQEKGDVQEVLDQIRERYNGIIRDLSLSISLDADFDEICSQLERGCGVDYVASRGEYLNGKLLADYLGFAFVDAADVVCFSENGEYLSQKTYRKMREHLENLEKAVIPGFYGARPDGTIQTFSRGGSDISGAIVARSVNADVYENWTDVTGFLVCDPRIVDHPKGIRYITYRELRELSYMGATVLHADSIFPVKETGIPINIRSTNEPEHPGTMIVANVPEGTKEEIVTGIAGKKGFVVFRIEKDHMNEEIGFILHVLEVFNRYKINIEHLPSGIDTMCVIVSEKELDGRGQLILDELARAVTPDFICMERGVALIAVVGHGMKSVKGTASRLFTAVAEAGVNIRMIDQGSSELNIILGIQEEDFEKAIRQIYHAFY